MRESKRELKSFAPDPRNPVVSRSRVHVRQRKRFLIRSPAEAFARSFREDPSIPQASKFNSQRKLDLPLAILYLCIGPPIMRLFRERAYVTYSLVILSAGENLDVEMVAAAKVRMVYDVEEFGAELQHAGLSQEPLSWSIHQRKVPIPFGRPDQTIA